MRKFTSSDYRHCYNCGGQAFYDAIEDVYRCKCGWWAPPGYVNAECYSEAPPLPKAVPFKPLFEK